MHEGGQGALTAQRERRKPAAADLSRAARPLPGQVGPSGVLAAQSVPSPRHADGGDRLLAAPPRSRPHPGPRRRSEPAARPR
eukprot:1349297-Alexandrium_andersonii.AAC.1